jgi:hypothetical protein
MRAVTITLPLPDRDVSQNARTGNSRIAAVLKSKKVRQHRNAANMMMKVAIGRGMLEGAGRPMGYSLKHYFKSEAWMRDEDNADGACKAYRDGICDALRIDDKYFTKMELSKRLIDKEHPRVEITIYFETKQATV